MDIFLILKVIVIGIVEGITEFLPISSTGHIILAQEIINYKEPFVSQAFLNMFDVVIQLGAILSVIVLYRKKIIHSLVHFKDYGLRLWINIIIAFFPLAIVGFFFKDIIDNYLSKPIPIACALIFGAILLIIFENKFKRRNAVKKIEDVNISQSIKIGLFQCLALCPGMSRSASTIMGGWFGGLNNVAAAEFSFFLAIPTMTVASGYELLKAIFKKSVSFNSTEVTSLVIGFVVSFIVALFVVDKFIGYLKKKPMSVFAIYRMGIGIVVLVFAALKMI